MSGAHIPVIISEPQLETFLRRYPALTRTQVLHAIVRHGPERLRVEAELERLTQSATPDAARG
jgi:hypothetical protein